MAKCDIFLEKQSENSDKGDIDFYSLTDGMSEFLLGNLKLYILCLVSTIIFGAIFEIIMCGEFYFITIV